MGFIGDLIGGIIGALISGGIAIYISNHSITKERQERHKEKLQDRKDMWLNEHYKQLSMEFPALSTFSRIITVVQEGQYVTPLEVIQPLGTRLVKYEFKPNYIKVRIKLELNDVKKTYKNITSHLQNGYPDIYAKMEKLWECAKTYKDLLDSVFNGILKRVQELMKINFPDLNQSSMNTKPNSYYIKGLITMLITGIFENDEVLEFDSINRLIYSKVEGEQIISNVNDSFYNKFKNNVWKILNDEFKRQINDLYEKNENLLKAECKFENSINKIINEYNSGHVIEGYCDICQNIYHEKDIKKLRPKV